MAKTATKRTSRRSQTRSTKTSSASRPKRSRQTERGATPKQRAVGEEQVTIDRRRAADRRGEERAASVAAPEAPQLERRQKVNRRRQIDPTTCERDYTEQEVEFMNALDEYKRRSGRMFPTCSEVLEVVRSLGYVKLSPAERTGREQPAAPVTSAKPMPSDPPASDMPAVSAEGSAANL